MKPSKVHRLRVIGKTAGLAGLLALTLSGLSFNNDWGGYTDSRGDRFRSRGSPRFEGPGVQNQATEAPAAFDNLSNGFLTQGPDFETLNEDTVVPLRSFNDNRFVFEETETIGDGLGPTFNAQSCRECHQNVVTGGAAQLAELRTVRLEGGNFFDSQGGSIIQARATHPDIVERVTRKDNVRAFRMSLSTLGDGFVECIADSTLMSIRDAQPRNTRGEAVLVPVLEAGSVPRVGRFGWKSQHASLESFSTDAYLNEMGITTPLLPEENLSMGRFVGFGTAFDPVPEPEDDGEDVRAFADFMRATKAPPRGPITADVRAGEQVFNSLGCAVCHTPKIVTAPPGTKINGGVFTVPPALGNKIIHPFSDFLLHNIGTGDGIPIQPGPEFIGTANKMRTAPLWGLRTRNRLMHDGQSFTTDDAIRRHSVEAADVVSRFKRLSDDDERKLFAFLESL